MNTNPHALRILCFGDSYTWGYIPNTKHKRYNADIRWTGVMQNTLGKDYEVIEEGLNSRTLKSDDLRTGKEGRNGSSYFIPCLDTHDPIDLVIILLGTNELKDAYKSNPKDIEEIVKKDYVEVVLNRKSQFRETNPKLLLVSPPQLDLSKNYARERYLSSGNIKNLLSTIYERICTEYGCYFFDSSKIVEVGEDGVHFDADNHTKLGVCLAKYVKEII